MRRNWEEEEELENTITGMILDRSMEEQGIDLTGGMGEAETGISQGTTDSVGFGWEEDEHGME